MAPGAGVALTSSTAPGRPRWPTCAARSSSLNFWASWCEPCTREAPLLEKAQQRLAREGGTVLGVTYKDRASASRDFAARAQLHVPVASATTSWTSRRSSGRSRLPETFVLDRRGRVVAISRGEITDERFLDAAIDQALKEPAT